MLHPVFVFSACQIKDLSASQRRRSIVTQFVLLNASQMLHPVFVFSACQIKDLSASQRRLTTVAAKAHRFRLHPVDVFPSGSILSTFTLLIFFIDSYAFAKLIVCQMLHSGSRANSASWNFLAARF